MIEVIYDKDKQEKDEFAEKKKEIKMPKNMRQIGTPNVNKRIFIEDYVVTYLNFISRPGSTHARGAILLGETLKTENGDVIFISGAVDAQSIEFDLDENTFTKEIWSEIYEDIKENFSELSVVGWFLSRMGFSTAVNDKITKIHVDNFPGRDKVLYIYDSLEDEDAFYMYEKGELTKQKGYYIYYAKNEAMQNYIIKQKGDEPEEKNNKVNKKDAELIKNFREINDRYKASEKKNGSNMLYIASSFVVVALLAIGITVVNNYDRMKNMELSLNRLELTSGDESSEANLQNDTEDVAQALVIDDTSSEDVMTTEADTGMENNTSDTTYENTEDGTGQTDNNGGDAEGDSTETNSEDLTEEVTEEPEITTEQSLPASTGGSPTYYVIQSGDTLTSISLQMYDSIKYIDAIAEANGITPEDKIYEGQEIIIPSVGD